MRYIKRVARGAGQSARIKSLAAESARADFRLAATAISSSPLLRCVARVA